VEEPLTAEDPDKKTMIVATADPTVAMTMMIVEATAVDGASRPWMKNSAVK